MRKSNIKVIVLLLTFFIKGIANVFSQQKKTLPEVIKEAQLKSIQAKQSALRKEASVLSYSLFQLNKKPLLSLDSKLLGFNNDNFQVVQPDGSIKYLRRRQNESYVGIGFTQPVTLTNGTFSINSELYRVDNFINKSTQYNGIPIYIQYTQPLFTFNEFRWNREIELLKLLESDLGFKLEMNILAFNVCSSYFEVVEARNEKSLSLISLQINKASGGIEKRKVELGQSTEDKLLQLQMQDLALQQTVVNSEIRIQQALTNLKTYIPDLDTTNLELDLPEGIPTLRFDMDSILKNVNKNSNVYLANKRKLKEAQLNVMKTKVANKQVSLIVNYGLSKTADKLESIYQQPNNQQRVSIGIAVPIYDWGKRKQSVALATNLEKQIELDNIAQETTLNNEITGLLLSIPILQQNINNAVVLNTLAKKRLSIADRLYVAGKITLFDLQSSEFAKETAYRSYVNAIRNFWETYYQFKSLTGIDLGN